MIFESCEYPIPSSCEIMKVGRQLYVYLRLKSTIVDGRVLRRKICIGRCKIQSNDRKVLLPNTNYFHHFDKPLPTMESVRDRGRPRRATLRRTPRESMDAWTVTYQKIAQSCALSQVLEAIFGHLEAQAILSNACRAIFHDETLVNANPEVKKENLHRFLSMWHSLTCDGAQNVFECETQTSSVRALCRFRFFFNRLNDLPTAYEDLLSSTSRPQTIDITGRSTQNQTLLILSQQEPDAYAPLVCNCSILQELPIKGIPCIRDRVIAWQHTSRPSDGLDSLSCEFRHKEQHGRLFLYRHAARQALEQAAFLRMLSAAKSHLSHSPILSAYDQDRLGRYFDIGARRADGRFTFTQKDDAIAIDLQCCGTMGLFTTEKDLTPIQALDTYEYVTACQNFLMHSASETPLAMLPRDQLGFFLFIALIVYSKIQQQLKIHALKNTPPIRQIADRLASLKLVRRDSLWVLLSKADDDILAWLKAFDLPIVLSTNF